MNILYVEIKNNFVNIKIVKHNIVFLHLTRYLRNHGILQTVLI